QLRPARPEDPRSACRREARPCHDADPQRAGLRDDRRLRLQGRRDRHADARRHRGQSLLAAIVDDGAPPPPRPAPRCRDRHQVIKSGSRFRSDGPDLKAMKSSAEPRSTPLAPIALSMGEPAGIGPEVTLKAWAARKAEALPAFLAVGAPSLYRDLAARLKLDIPI